MQAKVSDTGNLLLQTQLGISVTTPPASPVVGKPWVGSLCIGSDSLPPHLLLLEKLEKKLLSQNLL